MSLPQIIGDTQNNKFNYLFVYFEFLNHNKSQPYLAQNHRVLMVYSTKGMKRSHDLISELTCDELFMDPVPTIEEALRMVKRCRYDIEYLYEYLGVPLPKELIPQHFDLGTPWLDPTYNGPFELGNQEDEDYEPSGSDTSTTEDIED